MEQQSTGDPLKHGNIDMGHIRNGVNGNFRYSSNGGRVIKREMVDEFKYGLSNAKLESPRDVLSGFDIVSMSTMTQQSDFKDRQPRRISPEAEAGAWLRDEPMDDIAKSGGLHPSPSAALGGRECGGSGESKDNTESGGLQCLTDGSWSPGCAQDVSEDAAPQQGSSTTASLLAQLRATKIKESVILDAIQRYGGGQKGLRGVIRAIMFWLAARNRFTSQSSDPYSSQSQSPTPTMEEVDQLPWSNAELGRLVDVQSGAFGNFNDALPVDPSCMMNSSFCRDDGGSLCDLKRGGSGSGEQGELPSRENQLHVCTGEIGTCAPLPQVSGFPQKGVSSLSSGNWVLPRRDYMSRHENMSRARMIRKLSPSPDRSGLHGPHDVSAYDDSVSHKSKIRRHSPSPAGFTSFQCASDVPSYGSAAAPPVPEISGTPGILCPVGPNPFAPGGPFSLSPSSPPPMDPQFSDFALGMQGSIYVDENLGIGSSAQGCGRIDRLGSFGYPVSSDSSDQKNSGAQLGVLSKSKSVPAACTRLARKNRMDRNRKAALFQVNRGALETGVLLAGKTGGTWSSGSLRTSSRSQGSPASEGQACRTKDRRDQEHLQFLLQKVLRPSDVGNLGRIVLPKKDAECHLPWLGAREGIQFACEDYDTGEKMALRYRFWPNNKSRMYLLENTGDFVKKHQLQESDRMLIYRNQQEGIYVIRARKARDCVGGLPSKVHTEEMGGEGKEIREQNSPGGTSSGTFSSDRDVETPESNVCSGLEGAPEPPVLGMVTSQDDLLNLADLPDAPMGEGTVNLVRFPSLESFDVELLELGPAVTDKQDGRSCVLIPDGD